MVVPPRSGHVAFTVQDTPNQIYIFGGYAEEDDDGVAPSGMPRRYPTNDLWSFNTISHEWKCLQKANLWDPTTSTSSRNPSIGQPQQRLAAAAVGFNYKALLMGGWDSQQVGSGGMILNTIDIFTPTPMEGDTVEETTSLWSQNPSIDLGEPTSRHIAVRLDDTTAMIHNHRCIDHVLLIELLNHDQVIVRRQPTKGKSPPSPRGLHVATVWSKRNKVIVFGGAAQSGDMSNELFVLDTLSWEWMTVQIDLPVDDGNGGGLCPSPRASPCFCTLDEDDDDDQTAVFLLFGGADRSMVDEGIPLHGCNDLWLLHLSILEDGTTKNTVSAKWECLDTSTPKTTKTTLSPPPGRNAATLTKLPNEEYTFMLQGGWYPFRKTHQETYLLKLKKEG